MANSQDSFVTKIQTHVIRTQRVELRVRDQYSAQQAQSRIDGLKKNVLTQQLNDVFDAHVPPNLCINIDTLTLELGDCPLDENFEQQFAQKLKEQLSHFIQNLHLQSESDGITSMPNTDVIVQDNVQRSQDLLLFYLDHGVLPWWENNPNWDIQAHFDELFTKTPEVLISRLGTLQNLAPNLRLIQQLNPDQVSKLLKAMERQSQLPLTALQAYITELKTWLKKGSRQGDKLAAMLMTLKAAQTKVLNWLTNSSKSTALLITTNNQYSNQNSQSITFSPQYIRQFIDIIRTDTQVPKSSIAALVRLFNANHSRQWEFIPEITKFLSQIDIGASLDSVKKDTEMAPNLTESQKGRSSEQDKQSPLDTKDVPLSQMGDVGLLNIAAASTEQYEAIQTDLDELNNAQQLPTELQNAKFYVNNAGLVLLWPFLGHFFRDVALTKDGEFSTFEKRIRAVLLTEYLVSGQTTFIEHQLLLNKLLCGVAFNLPTEVKIKLTKEERRACSELINSVLHHWQGLGKTSAGGFKQAFLQRQGILTRHDNHWNMFIERSGYDVLLEKLPWSIGVVSTKWMEGPIYVEW
ncbi:contractile injection system tape measure protein [Aliiglaciecola sp. M165]|uniref:contractile injection system tape measure protein n=1 Tax=Aliiglaciecola sp. M165 TaxID=2593649 RepID=UPI00117ED968|nr:contractile injection system tape measure protein [Aliiglaciecola sp. M165]TRY29846.1 hypothetical protein FM019_16905 [Aliiglaciecola sp. M165]